MPKPRDDHDSQGDAKRDLVGGTQLGSVPGYLNFIVSVTQAT